MFDVADAVSEWLRDPPRNSRWINNPWDGGGPRPVFEHTPRTLLRMKKSEIP
jgi:hypothetical protein